MTSVARRVRSTVAAGLVHWNGSDGTLQFPTDIDSYGGISGLTDSETALFLAGVFLGGGGQPADPPPRLDLSPGGPLGHDFQTVSPRLGQTFFVRDGLAQPEDQQFVVPQGATHLYLGFSDAYGFSGEPGYYDDNLGSLDVTVKIGTALVPTGPARALRLADGKVSIPVASVSLPDRLVISRVRFTPNPVRSRSVIRARFRVADLRGTSFAGHSSTCSRFPTAGPDMRPRSRRGTTATRTSTSTR